MRLRPFAVLISLFLVPRLAYPQGEPLGSEFRVNTQTTLQQSHSSVASGGSGFIVVWTSYLLDGSSSGVAGQRFDSSGTPLGTQFQVNTHTTNSQVDPEVDTNASGDFVVVWVSNQQDGSDGGVFGQRYAASGAPLGPEFRVNTSVFGDQFFPDVAVDPSGGFLVAWASGPPQAPGVDYDVFAQRYDSSGAPAGPEFRVNTFTTRGLTSSQPSVAADPAGNFVVVWSGGPDQDGSADGVFGRRFAGSGEPLGPEFRINTYTTDFQRYPAVATDPSGSFVVVWASLFQEAGIPGQNGVFGQRYASTGAPVGPEFHVNTYTPGSQLFPVVATDAAGNFVVVWEDREQEEDKYEGVYGQRYSSGGVPSGPEFHVNTTTTYRQHVPSLASDAAGTFLVTWHGYPGEDVFGQRFGGIFPVELMHVRVE